MKKTKRLVTIASLSSIALLLAACGNQKTSTGTLKPPTGFLYGPIYNYIAKPIQSLLEWIAKFFGGVHGSGYGIAILIFTLVASLIILPFMLRQQYSMTEQQEKSKVLKPQLDLLQKASKVAAEQTEQMQINGLMQDVYKVNGSSMMPKMGCAVMLIQLPIFSGLYEAVRYSPDISSSTFFGIKLGTTSIIITVIATLLYVFQSWMSVQSAAPEQRKQMMTMSLMSPVITLFISIVSPAGLGLYFLGRGVIIVIQQAIVTYISTPRIRRRLDAEYAEKPPVILVSADMFDETGRITAKAPQPTSFAQLQGMGMGAGATTNEPKDVTSSAAPTADELRARNSGKQKRD